MLIAARAAQGAFGAGGVAILAAFLLLERRVPRPLVPLRILRDRTRGTSYIARAAVGLASAGFFLIMTYYFQGILGFSPAKTGLSILPFIAGFIIAAQLVQRTVLARLGPRIVVTVAMILGAVAIAWLTHVSQHTSYASIVPELIILGAALGTIMVSTTTLGVAVSDPADVGAASAITRLPAARRVDRSAAPQHPHDHARDLRRYGRHDAAALSTQPLKERAQRPARPATRVDNGRRRRRTRRVTGCNRILK
jgi:hypothetical protein